MTTLLQDQTKAANQGKPGYDVLGNPLGTATTSSVGDAQVLANQQAAAKLGIAIPGVGGSKQTQSTTTLSSDKSADIAKIQNTTNNLSQTGVTTDPTTGVSVHADGTVYTPGATNEPVEAPANGVSAGGYVGETYYPAGAPLPQDAAGSYMPTTAYSPTDLSILNNLNNQRSQNDSLTSSIIASIQNQYTQLIEQQKQTNAGQNAGETKLLLRNGGLQHTGSGTNVLAATVSYGISQLADLNNKEQMAILQAQQAGQQADFQLQDRINQEISDIRDKKVATAVELNDKIAAANQKAADEKKAADAIKIQASREGAISSLLSQGITSPNDILNYLNYDDSGNQIGDFTAKEISDTLATLNPDKGAIQKVAQTLAENGADQPLIQKVLQAGDLNSAIALAGSNLQDPKLQLQLDTMRLDNELTKVNIAKAQKETSLLGEPTPAEKKAAAAALKESAAAIPVMQDKIEAVDVLKTAPGLSSRVGTGILSRSPSGAIETIEKGVLTGGLGLVGDLQAKLSGSGQDFAGGVHKLVNGMTLQNLIDAKARGATFGALSEGELNLLASSASTINDWEVKDSKGQGTGYWNIDEASFKKELDNIKTLTQRAITQSQGSMFSPDESTLLDNVYNPIESVSTPDQYYNNN